MLTPAFELKQNKDFLTVIIKAPFAKIAETEIFIEENDFKFYSKPYFLRLTLPGNIVEDGREKADYDVDSGTFTVVVPKVKPGEHFDGLDMITKLLAPKKKTKEATSLIEVIGEEENADHGDDDDNDVDDDDDFDWCIEQEPYVEKQGLLESPKYGFANQKSGVFERLQEDMVCIVDCPDPEKQNVTERRELHLQTEWEKFDEDHYISDLFEDEGVRQLLEYKPRFYEELALVKAGASIEQTIEFTDEEQDVLRKLPRKEYILDDKEETSVYLGLLDIIYAYAYNHRSTEGENHCESGWTICKISATLSWLEVFTGVREVVCSCYRRSLCYPLYRHWGLNEKVLQDVIQILQLGRRCLLKVLLEIRCILLDQDNRYVLNDLYITDYCVWIQSASAKKLQTLAEALSKIKITKEEVGFNLPEIEQLAKYAIDGEDNGGDDDDDVAGLERRLKKANLDSDIDVSESSDSDDESDTTEDSDGTDSDDVVTTDEGDDGKTDQIENVGSINKQGMGLENKTKTLISVIDSNENVGGDDKNTESTETVDSSDKLSGNNLISVIDSKNETCVKGKETDSDSVERKEIDLLECGNTKMSDGLICVVDSKDNVAEDGDSECVDKSDIDKQGSFDDGNRAKFNAKQNDLTEKFEQIGLNK